MKAKNWIINFLLVFVGLIVIFLIYAHYEYRHIKIRTIEIKSKDIPKEFDGKRVLFVADFQYDTMTRFNRVQEKKAIELTEKGYDIAGGRLCDLGEKYS